MLKQIILRKDKDRVIHNKHPWIFSGAAESLPPLEEGEIIQIVNHERQLVAYAFYAPGNQIIARVFEFTSSPKDVNAKAYWVQKIRTAFEIRQSFLVSEQTNAYRLIHAEGDFFPGLIADVYNNVVVLQFLIKGAERLQAIIVDAISRLGFEYIFAKSKKVSQLLENMDIPTGWVSKMQGPDRVEVLENGARFIVDFQEGQKTGFFLDQRDARALLAEFSAGKKVLNTFSYTGGFSIYALLAEAEFVHSVDSSESAIMLSEENAALNGFGAPKHEAFAEDVFDYLKKMEHGAYDIIVLDPPAFAKTAKSLINATRGYKELNLKAMQKIKPGGIIFTFSCSQKVSRDLFRKIIFGAAADSGRNVRILAQTTQGLDHPVNIYHPENEYLKGLVLQVE
jgi:23S rRNA (cytosine1962-C5)-methyltransferase